MLLPWKYLVKGRSNRVVNIDLETAAHRMLNLFHNSGGGGFVVPTAHTVTGVHCVPPGTVPTYLVRKDTSDRSDLRRKTKN
jgi:hypothetical protein